MKNYLIVCLLILSSISFGQDWIDLANVYFRTSPFNSIQGSSDQRHLNSVTANIKLPKVIDENNVILFGLEHQYNSIVSPSSSSLVDLEFSSTMLQIGWEHKWNKKTKILFMSMTRLNSDFKNVGILHFQQGGVILGTTKRSDNFDWKYGLYYNGDFFGPMIVPLFGFNWKMNEKWRFKLMVPVNLELSYQPKKWLRTGFRFDGVNASYKAELTPGFLDSYIDKADNNAWVFSEFHLGKNVWFHLKAGYSVLRKYRVYQVEDKMNLKLGPINIGDDRWSTNALFNNGFSFEARFIYRLPL